MNLSEYVFVLPAILLALALVFGALGISRLVAPRHPVATKLEAYECGESTLGPTWIQFHVGYYIFGLIFLVFDVEAAFLFPWAVVLKEVGVVGLIEVVIFILMLLVGLLYAWKKGVLKWQ